MFAWAWFEGEHSNFWNENSIKKEQVSVFKKSEDRLEYFPVYEDAELINSWHFVKQISDKPPLKLYIVHHKKKNPLVDNTKSVYQESVLHYQSSNTDIKNIKKNIISTPIDLASTYIQSTQFQEKKVLIRYGTYICLAILFASISLSIGLVSSALLIFFITVITYMYVYTIPFMFISKFWVLLLCSLLLLGFFITWSIMRVLFLRNNTKKTTNIGDSLIYES